MTDEPQDYALVEAADACPMQEDVEWQDAQASINTEVAVPEPVSLGNVAADELARITRSYARLADARKRLDEYYRRATAFLDNRLRALDYVKRQQAYNLATHLLASQGGSKRSYDTPYGRVGFRRKPARLKVIDSQALINAALVGQIPAECIKTTTATTVVKAEVDKLYKNGGEVPPGCEPVPEQDEFYIG